MKKWIGIAFVATCLIGTSLPVMAAESGGGTSNWTLYGEIGMMVRYYHQDSDKSGTGESNTEMLFSPWDIADFGGKYKNGNFSAHVGVEMSDRTGGTGKSGRTTDIGMGDIWGEQDFGSFKFKFGKFGSLCDNPIGPHRGKYGNSGIGPMIGTTAEYGIEFTVPTGKSSELGFLVAKPSEFWATDVAGLDSEFTIPAFEAAYTSHAPFMWKVFAGFETYELTESGEDKTAYGVGVVANPRIGPFSLKATANYAQNMYMVGSSAPAQKPLGAWNTAVDADSHKLGLAASLEYKVASRVTVGCGVGYQLFTADDGDSGDYEDPMYGYSFNVKIIATKNIYFIPYAIYEDWDTITANGTEKEQGSTLEYGLQMVAKW